MAAAQNTCTFGGLFAKFLTGMKTLISRRSSLIYLLSAFFVSVVSTASPQLCQDVFSQSDYHDRKAAINEDLNWTYHQEIYQKSFEEIQAMNAKTLARIQQDTPPEKGRRLQATDLATLDKLYTTVMYHKVVSPLKIPNYDQPGTSIGYCFGRATYVHLKLLSLGIQKESIQKIWAVGPMKTFLGDWDFHVATMVYTKEKGWMVIDTFAGKVVTIAEWMRYTESFNTDNQIRYYNTDASKFGLSLGKYNRFQLGLELSNQPDWYRGYFKDMMAALKEEIAEQAKKKEEGKTAVHPFFDVERSPTWNVIKLFVAPRS